MTENDNPLEADSGVAEKKRADDLNSFDYDWQQIALNSERWRVLGKAYRYRLDKKNKVKKIENTKSKESETKVK